LIRVRITQNVPKIISLGGIELIVRAGLGRGGVGSDYSYGVEKLKTLETVAQTLQYITRKDGDGAVMGPDVSLR
jgi:hypothetical protein